MNNSFIDQMLQKGKEASEKVITEFDHLSSRQLNWKPSENKWSIGQCLDHLVVSDKQYFATLEKLASGNYEMNWWERNSPFTGFFGKMLVKQIGEIPKRKMNAPGIFQPSKSEIGEDIILRFYTHLDQLLNLINGCARVDLEKTIITSPVSKIITYNLKNAITILIRHLHRHINQGIRLKQAKGFPED